MTVSLYMDHHVPKAITLGLRSRGVDMTTAYEDGREEEFDPILLDRAGELERVLFTQDDDLLDEASKRQREGISFSGVVFAQQQRVPWGVCIRDLELIAKACEPEDMVNQVYYLPL
ncbi:MAG: DUF5615 family PIN-like protein [Chloroflexota bacterium]